MAHSNEANKFLETNSEETQASDLLNRKFIILILNMFKDLKEKTDTNIKEIKKRITKMIVPTEKEIIKITKKS